jgi:hypothetical protein
MLEGVSGITAVPTLLEWIQLVARVSPQPSSPGERKCLRQRNLLEQGDAQNLEDGVEASLHLAALVTVTRRHTRYRGRAGRLGLRMVLALQESRGTVSHTLSDSFSKCRDR